MDSKPKYNEIIFTDEQIEDIITSYQNGESSVAIGRRYVTSHKPILKILHKNNIEVDQKKFARKYKLNENYFDNITTQNQAYILGFLFADGNNNPKKSTVSMSLQHEDKYILEKIRNEIHNEHPLEFIDNSNKHDFGYHYKDQYRLLMFSTHMCKSLNKLGMCPNKSLVLEFPDIPEYLYPHFIRGYFDGDGTICKGTGGFSIVSTKQFVMRVKYILENILNINHGILYEAGCKNGITYNLSFHRKNESSKIYEWMYKDAELFLNRKYDIYKNKFNINDSLLV